MVTAERTRIEHTPCVSTRQPIRVCFLIDRLDRAGTESQLLMLIRHLDQTRVCPYLCLLDGEDEVSQSLEPEDCPVLRLGVKSLHKFRAAWQAVRFVKYLRRERIDVVQAYFPDSTYFGVPVARMASVPVIVRTRNNLGYAMTTRDRLVSRMLNHLTRATVANCEACRASVIETDGARPDSVIVLENGIELERYKRIAPLSARTPVGQMRVGMVANLRPVKDPESFVRAAAQVAAQHPHTQFEIAGDGPMREAVQRLAAHFGLEKQFHVHGAVADVPGFLGDLDVAVLSSRSEGLSNAVLEYMAAGRAIVATAVGETPRLIDNEIHGLVVPPEDPQALAEGIGRLLADRELAQELGVAARSRAFDQFSAMARARRFEEFWATQLRRKR